MGRDLARPSTEAVEGEVDYCHCGSTSASHTLECLMEGLRRAGKGGARRDGPDFLSEIVGFATERGIVPVTRARLHQLCIERGETPAEADASAFGPWTRPLRGDEPGIVADWPEKG